MRCHEKQGNTEVSKRLSNRSKVILFLAGAALMLVGGVAARYFWQTWSEYATVTSEPFYFTADLLGDTEMTADAENLYSMADPSGEWHLYGGGEHTVDFTIQNYYDDLRITQNAINYTAKVKDDGGIIGVKLTGPDGNTLADSLTLGVPTTVDGKETYLEANQTLRLTIPKGYTEEKTVTVEITSTKPYKKTLTLNFKVHPAGEGLIYEVVDNVNSPYAELIIRNDTGKEVQPTIKWDEKLSIDNTNELTFTYNNGTFTQQEGIVNREMRVSRKLKIGESVSIYFFKSESNKSYAQNNTINNTTISDYTITIKDPTQEVVE